MMSRGIVHLGKMHSMKRKLSAIPRSNILRRLGTHALSSWIVSTSMYNDFVLYISVRAITLVHLLTNKDWGPGIPQMRFLSCRQSHPMRDKLTEVGDSSVAGEAMIEIGSVREQLSSMFRSAEALKKLLERLRARKFVFAMKCSDEKVVASIELVPASNPHAKRSVCTLTISGGSPSLILSPTMRRFVSGGFYLQVRTGSVSPSSAITPPILDSIEDELTQAQSSAVDYAIIEILQNEQSASQHLGWIRTYASKHNDNFSVTFATLAVNPLEITVGLFPSALRVTEEFAGITKALRAAYLEWCGTKTDTDPHLSQHLFSFISASSG